MHNDPLTYFDAYGLLDLGQYDQKPANRAAQDAGFFWGLNRFTTNTLQSACWFADHLSPVFTMSTPSTYFRSLGDRTTAWMEERLGKKTQAQWENPHFQNGYKSAYWGSEGATFFAMGGTSLLKGGYQAATSFLSRSGSRFAQEMGTLAGKAAQTLQTISANSIGNYPATSSVSAYLFKNKLVSQEISGGNAFIKHVIKQKEFPGFSRFQFQGHIQTILNNPTEMKLLTRGRTAYW